MKFPPQCAPYYIVTPPWNRCSAGVRALHYLCHYLNKAGAKAYLVFLGGNTINPMLDTPRLTDEIDAFYKGEGLDPIAVYPDIVKGNPLGAKHVVRYLLYYAGAYGGDAVFPETDLIYAYSKAIADRYGKSCRVLALPISDPDIFYPPAGESRSGALYYAHKRRMQDSNITPPAEAKEITHAWPHNQYAVAEAFRQAEVFYAYEDTTLIVEAMLCGCKVVRCFDSAPFPEFETPEAYSATVSHFDDALYRFTLQLRLAHKRS